jgi:hypothetical protein
VRKLLITTAIALVAIFIIAPRFVRWTTNRPNVAVGAAGLRLAVLQRTLVDSNTVADSNDVTCVVMDWNMGGKVTATLAAFADGRTSFYVSPGTVVTSKSEGVRAAAERFRAAVAAQANQFSTTADFDPPGNGKTRFYLITRTGTFATMANLTVVLQNQTHYLHPLLEAGQAAVAEIQRPN